MGWFESVMNKFGFVKKSNTTYVNFLDGNGAFYTQFGDSIYASDVVQSCISSIVTEMKKLQPMHIIFKNGRDPVLVTDSIQKVLENPNQLMTTGYYIEKMVWNLFLNYNAFAWPEWKGDKLVSLTPLQPTNVEFYTTPTNELWVTMRFKNGYEGNVPYKNLVHLRRNYSVNEVMGGNEKGQPDDSALMQTLKLNDKLLKNLAKQLDMQMTVQGIIKYKGTVGKEDPFVAVKDFESKVKEMQTAFLPVDNTAEIQTISKNVQMLDPNLLEFIDTKICRYFGTSVSIISGDYSLDQFNAFYQKAIEPLATDFDQTHTKAIFTDREAFGYGHKIIFKSSALIHLSPAQTLEYFRMGIDTASVYKNEFRFAFGNVPLAELEGQLAVSSNQQNALNNKPGEDETIGGVANE